MKILLVFPRIEHGTTTVKDKGSLNQTLVGNPIITLPHIAAITPKKHSVEIVNENFENIDFNADADLVGITTYTMTAPRAYEIADEFKRRGKKVVLIEDVVSSGGAIIDAAAKMRKDGIKVDLTICVIDRETGGKEKLAEHGIKLISLLTRTDLDDAA